MADEIIRLTREQVREYDRRASEEYGIPGIVLMENAARGVVEIALHMLQGRANPKVVVLCGSGNNGGDGFAVARHLHNHGCKVLIELRGDPRNLSHDAQINFNICSAMRIDAGVYGAEAVAAADLIIDAIFGTGLSRPIEPPLAGYIDEINRLSQNSNIPILAIDVPSGLDANTGAVLGTCIRANRTVTFVARKPGFDDPLARQFTGEVLVAQVGAPRELRDFIHQLR